VATLGELAGKGGGFRKIEFATQCVEINSHFFSVDSFYFGAKIGIFRDFLVSLSAFVKK
jgi:hypothetical protein